MSDLELTKLCAEAMGYTVDDVYPDGHNLMFRNGTKYLPLHDDAQAMAMVKHLRLHINDMKDGNTRAWGVMPGARGGLGVYNRDLNRAIVECVAKMQGAK